MLRLETSKKYKKDRKLMKKQGKDMKFPIAHTLNPK